MPLPPTRGFVRVGIFVYYPHRQPMIDSNANLALRPTSGRAAFAVELPLLLSGLLLGAKGSMI